MRLNQLQRINALRFLAPRLMGGSRSVTEAISGDSRRGAQRCPRGASPFPNADLLVTYERGP